MDCKEILERIRRIRQEVSVSAKDLSVKLGMGDQYVSKLEMGKVKLRIDIFLKILQVCDCSLEKFFSVDSDEKEIAEVLKGMPSEKKARVIEWLKSYDGVR